MGSKVTCRRCGERGEGTFCTSCGGVLSAVFCSACGTESERGDRFCNRCGAPLGPSAAPPGQGPAAARPASGGGSSPSTDPGWWVAGILMVALILAVAIPAVRSAGDPPASAPAPAADAGGGGPATGGMPDLSSMTPRQAADRLYNRIMSAAGAGDSAQVAQFLPMGIGAYERARPLDADGLFHLALLQRMALEPVAALATAEEALTAHPNHLLNLSAAAGAAAEAGDTTLAEQYYQRLLDSWETEMQRQLQEYQIHGDMMDQVRDEAETFLDRE